MTSRAERIVILWSTGHTADEIADQTGYSRDTVFFHLKRAREIGDARAARRQRQAPSCRRRAKIAVLHAIGHTSDEIAKLVDCTVRTVQMRIKEMG